MAKKQEPEDETKGEAPETPVEAGKKAGKKSPAAPPPEEPATGEAAGEAASEAAGPKEGSEPAKPGPPKGEPPAAEEEPSIPAPDVPEGKHYFWGTGRRKKAIARVRIRPGSGKFVVNKSELEEYFKQEKDRQLAVAPLQTVKMLRSWDVWANVRGGGFTGQAGAVTLGLARALSKAAPELEGALRGTDLLTRDSRMKERKKYGQKGARKRFQFSKR